MSIRESYPEKWEKDVIYTDMTNLQPGSHVARAMEVVHDPANDAFISLSRGPLTLCADSRVGKHSASVFEFARKNREIVCRQIKNRETEWEKNCMAFCEFEDENGENFYLIDYASAGHDWNTEIAVWLATQKL